MVSVSKTITPKVPSKEAFSKFWNQVQSAGIIQLGYGVVSPSKTEDHYVICPEISSDGLGMLETLEEVLDYKIQSLGSGKIPFVPKGAGYDIDTQWTITLALWYNPSSPSLYLFLEDGSDPLQVYNKTGEEVWKQIKEMVNKNPTAFPYDENRLTMEDTSIRNIFVMKLLEEKPWAAINNQVVLP